MGWLVVAGALSLLAAAAPAAAKPFSPGKNRAFHGVSDTGHVGDFRTFKRQVKAHPATLQMFFHWGVPLRSSGALHRWSATNTRGVLSLSTAPGGGQEVITPRRIAIGFGDHYILRLKQTIANAGQTVYIRLMPEMNGYWNPYSGFNADGSRRAGQGKSPRAFRRAWRRFAIIIRGRSRERINRRLRKLGMPRIHRVDGNAGRRYRQLDVPKVLKRPRVALMWVPQTFGSPNVRGNQPPNYWPGRKYVDWVGADIYSKWASPGVWTALDRFFKQRRWRGLPFAIGEYSPYDDDHGGAFVRKLFRWERKRRRVKMLLYYRSVTAGNPHNVQHYPGARRVLRRQLRRKHYRRFGQGVRKVPFEPPPKAP